MQYTSKLALLAVALFGSSALAAPFGGDAEYDVEAREVENDLSAREFLDMYLEARSDPSLDARDLESMDFEAREYLDYLEARDAGAVQVPENQTPLSPKSLGETHELSASPGGNNSTEQAVPESPHTRHLTKHQKAMRHLRKVALAIFKKDPKKYQAALKDVDSKYHRFAVWKYLSKTVNMKNALANKTSPYYEAAKHIRHRQKAKVYLESKVNFVKALNHRKNKYHKDAVRQYLSIGDHYELALTDPNARFHKAAVYLYLQDRETLLMVLSDSANPYYKMALRIKAKQDKRHLKKSSGTTPASTSPAIPAAA